MKEQVSKHFYKKNMNNSFILKIPLVLLLQNVSARGIYQDISEQTTW